jgi:hypothetical protein
MSTLIRHVPGACLVLAVLLVAPGAHGRDVRPDGVGSPDHGPDAGTGGADFTLGGSATTSLGSIVLLGDLAYWWLGDLPELELRDGLSYGLAAATPILDGRGTLIASLSGAGRLVDTLDPPMSVTVALGYRPEGACSLSGGVSAGLTESASDFAVFMGWSRRFDRGP